MSARRVAALLLAGVSLVGAGCARRFHTDLPSPKAFPVSLPEPPLGIPAFIGATEAGPDGYAPQTVDAVGVAALLRARRFLELDRAFAAYQGEFERDYRREYWPLDALDAFDTADAALDPLLDEWIGWNTRSYAARAARGVHRIALAWFYRGEAPSAQTAPARKEAFQALSRLAEEDLRKSLKLNPRFLAATRNLLVLSRTGEPRGAPLLSSALESCPACYQVRATYLVALHPEWCGSRAEMDSFARKEAGTGRSSRLRLLEGAGLVYDAALKRRAGDLNEAERLCEKALAFGESWELLQERAAVSANRNDYRKALSDLDRAVALRPQLVPLLRYRSSVAATTGDWRKAGDDLLTALRLDPVSTGTDDISIIVPHLFEERRRLLRIGDDEGADAVARVAAGLDPQGTITEAAPSEPERPSPPAALDTGNRAACLRAEAELLPGRKWNEIASIWTAYLDQHPDDGEAFYRRAGYRDWLGEVAGAREDYARACELGVSGACALRVRR